MKPRLVAITGHLEGRVFELDEGPFTLGRQSSNRLQLRQRSVSRRQCVIEAVDGRYRLRDLGSRHGTFVNGAPVNEHPLEHGDFIKISDTLFLFLLRPDSTTEDASSVRLDRGSYVADSTVLLSVDFPETSSDRLLTALESAARTAQQLHALLEISNALYASRGVDALAQRLLELVLEVLPAQRAAILLVQDDNEDLVTRRGLDKRTPERPVEVSQTIARQVMKERQAMLANDVLRSEAFDGADSLQAARIHSLICAPLPTRHRVLGVLYADTRDFEVRFDEDHLRLVTALAGVAGVAFEHARHVETLERRLRSAEGLEHDMVGESPPMQKAYQLISRVAPTDATVLIVGESGTGKELAARAIHRNSPRAEQPFVAINCANLSETLLESELFGHERGAFTGAEARKLGKLEIANAGTLFLDEVGEIPLGLQAKLLRVLETLCFERVGGHGEIRVDVRIIAATNRHLKTAIAEGSFRADLFFRLNVITLSLPPLRERQGDIPLLAEHFVALCGRKFGRSIRGLSPEARDCVTRYDWPGNVRELANAIERAVILGEGDRIELDDLPDAVVESGARSRGAAPRTYHAVLRRTKRRLIREAFQAAGGSYVETARRLDLSPNYLHRLIRNLDMKPELNRLQDSLSRDEE